MLLVSNMTNYCQTFPLIHIKPCQSEGCVLFYNHKYCTTLEGERQSKKGREMHRVKRGGHHAKNVHFKFEHDYTEHSSSEMTPVEESWS